MGVDLHADETGRARALLYAPRAVEQTLGNIAVDISAEPAAAGAEVPSTMPLVFRARSVVTASGTFGHLRIFTFSVRSRITGRPAPSWSGSRSVSSRVAPSSDDSRSICTRAW